MLLPLLVAAALCLPRHVRVGAVRTDRTTTQTFMLLPLLAAAALCLPCHVRVGAVRTDRTATQTFMLLHHTIPSQLNPPPSHASPAQPSPCQPTTPTQPLASLLYPHSPPTHFLVSLGHLQYMQPCAQSRIPLIVSADSNGRLPKNAPRCIRSP